MTPSEIRKLRRDISRVTAKFWSQERMAHEIGVSWATYQRWETGKTKPLPMALEKIEELRKRYIKRKGGTQ